MPVWLVRAGASGDRQGYALDHNVAVVGWDEIVDLRPYSSRDAIKEALSGRLPNFTPKQTVPGRTFTTTTTCRTQEVRAVSPSQTCAFSVPSAT
jgi:hypothetical protein